MNMLLLGGIKIGIKLTIYNFLKCLVALKCFYSLL